MVIALEPVLATLGPITVRWLGVFWLLGALVAAACWLREVGRSGPAVSRADALDILAWVAPAALVGARVFHILAAADHYALNPEQLAAPGRAGYALWGALAFGGAAGAIVARARGLAVAPLLGAAAPALALGEAVGRVGCLIDGTNLGIPTDLPWGVRYVDGGSQAPDLVTYRHPVPLYHALAALAAFGALRLASGRAWPPSALFALWLSLHASTRITLGFVRLEPPFLLGLQQAQWWGIVALVGVGFVMIRRWRRPVEAPAARC